VILLDKTLDFEYTISGVLEKIAIFVVYSMKSYKNIQCSALDDVLCDICGISCKKLIDIENYNIENASLFARWGYGSKMDGLCYEIDLCEQCFSKTIEYLKTIKTIETKKDPFEPVEYLYLD